MTRLLILPLILFASVIASAQYFEYGQPSELKGLKSVLIDTGADLTAYHKIRKTLEDAKLPDLAIVEDADHAEIVLALLITKDSVVSSDRRGNISDDLVTAGQGYVTIAGKVKKLRLVMNFASRQDGVREKHPAEKFAKAFIKEYKKANSIK